MPEDAPGELVAGHLHEEEMADPIHELAVTWLIALFREWLGKRGFVFSSDVRMALSDQLGRKPDVAVFLPGGHHPPRRGALQHPPDIVVEVVTPSPKDERRDRVEKMTEYAAFGVHFYWLVDPALGSLEIFELGKDNRYTKVLGETEGVITPVPGCTGLELSLNELWDDLNRLRDD